MNTKINIQIVITKPFPGVVYSMQSGSGKVFENVQGQLAKADDLIFEGSIDVKTDTDGEPDFKGVIVQGPKLSRFIYIGIGTYAGQPGSQWARRLKIPLSGITRDTIAQLEKNPDGILLTLVPGIGRDGGPNCATVKPFVGWTAKNKQ